MITAFLITAVQQAPVLARQVAPNIYVTVQPGAPGLPEWARILISASVGALLGTSSSVLMEFVKPSIAKRQLKKFIKAHLIPEATLSAYSIEACRRVFGAVENVDKSGHYAMDFAKLRIDSRSGEMYEHFFNKERLATHEIDRHMALRAFYNELHAVAKGIDEGKYRFNILHALISSLSQLGRTALDTLGAPLEWRQHSEDEQRCLKLISDSEGEASK
jgi:hypothetical protein